MSFGIFLGFLGIQVKIRFAYHSLDFEVFFFISFFFSFFFYDVIMLCTLVYASVAKEKKGHMSLFLFPIVYHISQLIKYTIVSSKKKKKTGLVLSY